MAADEFSFNMKKYMFKVLTKYFSFFSFFFVFLLDILQNTQHTKIKSTSAVSQGALGADVRLDDAFSHTERFSSEGSRMERGRGFCGWIVGREVWEGPWGCNTDTWIKQTKQKKKVWGEGGGQVLLS